MGALTIEQKKFLVANVLVAFGIAISTTFFNLFLFHLIEGSIVLMALLYLCKFASAPMGFYIGTNLTRRLTLPKINGVGLLLLVTVILIALLGSQWDNLKLEYFVIVMGLIWGIGDGLYWMSFNSLQQVMISGENRAAFLGINGGWTNMAYIAAPLLATVFVSQYQEKGYIIIFILMMINYLLAFGIMNMLKVSSERRADQQPFRWQMVKESRLLKQEMLLNHLIGLREGVIVGFLSILYLDAFAYNEVAFGWFNTFNAVLIVLANFLFARVYQSRVCVGIFITAVCLLMISGWNLGMNGTMEAAILFGIVYNLMNPGFTIPTSVRSFSVIDHTARSLEDLYVNLTWREYGLNAGRAIAMLGIIILYPFIQEVSVQLIFILVHGFMAVLLYKYYRIFHCKYQLSS